MAAALGERVCVPCHPPEMERRMAATAPVVAVPTGVAGRLGSCWAAASWAWDRPAVVPMGARPGGGPTTPRAGALQVIPEAVKGGSEALGAGGWAAEPASRAASAARVLASTPVRAAVGALLVL